jgi:hypothetical protein
MRIYDFDAFDLSDIYAVEFNRRIGKQTGNGVLGMDLIFRVLTCRKQIPNGASDNADEQKRDEQEHGFAIDVVFHR